MNHKEILEKAIQKATDGGWKYPLVGEFRGVESDVLTGEYFAWSHITRSGRSVGLSTTSIIFSHDFAKALWANPAMELLIDSYEQEKGVVFKSRPWMIHLKEMVIADDPIEYLGKNI